MTTNKSALVISHKSCTDGAFAAWAARYHLRRAGYEYEDITVAFIDPGKTPPVALTNKWDIAFIVDVTIPIKDFLDLDDVCERGAYILDHHKTNQEALPNHPNIFFDMNRSGAGLAWDEIPRILGLAPLDRPWAVDYVEDRDLWRFALPKSKAVNAGIHHTIGHDLNRVDKTDLVSVRHFDNVGEVVLGVYDQQVEEAVRSDRSLSIRVGDYTFPVVMSAVHQSEIGSRLAASSGLGVGVVWYLRKTDEGEIVAQVSFRSIDSSAISASDIAKTFGGGGHHNAAGAAVPLSKWLSILS